MKFCDTTKLSFPIALKAFTISFIINFVVYLPELANMPLSDHDLGYLPGISYFSGGGVGRWFLPFIYAIRGFEVIPVLIPIFAFVMHISAGMAAVYLWYKEQASLLHYIVGGLFISLIPFTSEHFFFHWQAETFGFAQLCIILAIILSSIKKFKFFIISVILTVIALATYQSTIQTAAVCWMGVLILRIIDWDGTWLSIKKIASYLSPSALALSFGAAIYLLSITIIDFLGINPRSAYQLSVGEISFVDRIYRVIEHSITQFTYSQAYFPKELKILLLILVILSASILIIKSYSKIENKRSLIKIIILPLSLLMMIFTSKLQSLVVSSVPYDFRILATSLSYIYLFSFLTLLFIQKKIIKYFIYALGAILFLSFTVIDLKIQYSFIQQQKHDLALVNRIIYRVEDLKNFDATKKYNLVLFGVAPVFNSLSFDKNYEAPGTMVSVNTRTLSYPQGIVYSLLTPYMDIKKVLAHFDTLSTKNASPILVQAAELSVSRGQYPAQDSCFIFDDNIVIILEKKSVLEIINRDKQ